MCSCRELHRSLRRWLRQPITVEQPQRTSLDFYTSSLTYNARLTFSFVLLLDSTLEGCYSVILVVRYRDLGCLWYALQFAPCRIDKHIVVLLALPFPADVWTEDVEEHLVCLAGHV